MSSLKPLIFVHPLQETLQELHKIMKEIAENDGIEVYDLEDVNEYNQLFKAVGQSVSIFGSAKKCAQCLQANRKVNQKIHSKTILLTSKSIPNKTLEKFEKLGLTESIIEPVIPKSLLYKVRLQLKSIASIAEQEEMKLKHGQKQNNELGHLKGKITQHDKVEESKEDHHSNYHEKAIEGHLKGKVGPSQQDQERPAQKNKTPHVEEIDQFYRGKTKTNEPEHKPEGDEFDINELKASIDLEVQKETQTQEDAKVKEYEKEVQEKTLEQKKQAIREEREKNKRKQYQEEPIDGHLRGAITQESPVLRDEQEDELSVVTPDFFDPLADKGKKASFEVDQFENLSGTSSPQKPIDAHYRGTIDHSNPKHQPEDEPSATAPDILAPIGVEEKKASFEVDQFENLSGTSGTQKPIDAHYRGAIDHSNPKHQSEDEPSVTAPDILAPIGVEEKKASFEVDQFENLSGTSGTQKPIDAHYRGAISQAEDKPSLITPDILDPIEDGDKKSSFEVDQFENLSGTTGTQKPIDAHYRGTINHSYPKSTTNDIEININKNPRVISQNHRPQVSKGDITEPSSGHTASSEGLKQEKTSIEKNHIDMTIDPITRKENSYDVQIKKPEAMTKEVESHDKNDPLLDFTLEAIEYDEQVTTLNYKKIKQEYKASSAPKAIFHEGNPHGLDIVLHIYNLYLEKDFNSYLVLKYIAQKIEERFFGKTTFYLKDQNEIVEKYSVFAEDEKYAKQNEDWKRLSNIKMEFWKKMNLPTFSDSQFQEKENELIYPLNENGKALGFIVIYWDSQNAQKLNASFISQIEVILEATRGLYLEYHHRMQQGQRAS